MIHFVFINYIQNENNNTFNFQKLKVLLIQIFMIEEYKFVIHFLIIK